MHSRATRLQRRRVQFDLDGLRLLAGAAQRGRRLQRRSQLRTGAAGSADEYPLRPRIGPIGSWRTRAAHPSWYRDRADHLRVRGQGHGSQQIRDGRAWTCQ